MSVETGSVRKDPGGKLNIALVYPNTYWVGMSNLGVHTIYKALNDHPGIVCERFFTDRPRSVESGRPLNDFHLVAFSISYELDWINALKILIDNRIPVKAAERGGAPLVMAGGAAVTMNPEPIALAMDMCFLGDGEEMASPLFEAFESTGDYELFLDRLENVDGFYIPARTSPEYDGEKIVSFSGRTPVLSVLEEITSPACTRIITDETAFRDMFMVEIARGCYFSCRFCTARRIYHPFRPVSVDNLLPAFDRAKEEGLKLGLVSAALNNHPETSRMFEEITKRGLRIAPPSLRPGMITEEILELIRYSGVKGITIAPETGSETLRYAAGKKIKNETIIADVTSLVESGVRNIKLYFMVGLPGETLDDVEQTIDFIKRIRQIFIKVSRGNRKLGNISVSINTFIPKPNTPFERQPLLDPSEAKKRLKRISKALRGETNLSVSYEGPKWAYLQTLLARGDRSVLDLGARLAVSPGSSWQEVMRQWPRNPDYYALRRIPQDEVLPWSFY